MTTAAAFMDHKGQVAIASDRAWTGTGRNYRRKLHRVGDMAVASSGLGLMIQIIKDLAGDPEPPKTPRELAKRAFDAYLEAGQVRAGTDDKALNTSLLIIQPGQAPCLVDGAGCINQWDDQYGALGTGTATANGALHVARKGQWTAANAVRAAVKAAVHHDTWSGGKVDLIVFDAVEASQ